MGVFNYLFNVSFEQKKQDWQEYQKLRRDMAYARTIEGYGYARVIYGCDQHEAPQYIKNKCVVRTIEAFDPDSPQIDGPVTVDRTCEHFCWGGVRCDKRDCPSIKENHFYADAIKKRSEIEQKLNVFWKNKFKQKNK